MHALVFRAKTVIYILEIGFQNTREGRSKNDSNHSTCEASFLVY